MYADRQNSYARVESIFLYMYHTSFRKVLHVSKCVYEVLPMCAVKTANCMQ